MWSGNKARTCINAIPGGAAQIIFQGSDGYLYYADTGHFADNEFNGPQRLPTSTAGWEDIEATLDDSGNLHVAYPVGNKDESKIGLIYTMKPASSRRWSKPVMVEPLHKNIARSVGFSSIAIDGQNIYVANHNWQNVYVYASHDGGTKWQRTTLFEGNEQVWPDRHISIAVNKSHDIYVGTGFDIYDKKGNMLEEARIYRSRDLGHSWSYEVIPNQTSVSIHFDANDNAAINLWGTNHLEGTINFTKESGYRPTRRASPH